MEALPLRAGRANCMSNIQQVSVPPNIRPSLIERRIAIEKVNLYLQNVKKQTPHLARHRFQHHTPTIFSPEHHTHGGATL
jgi:hypothetical protein